MQVVCESLTILPAAAAGDLICLVVARLQAAFMVISVDFNHTSLSLPLSVALLNRKQFIKRILKAKITKLVKKQT